MRSTPEFISSRDCHGNDCGLRTIRGRYLNWTSTALLTRRQTNSKMEGGTANRGRNMSSVAYWRPRDTVTDVEIVFLMNLVINLVSQMYISIDDYFFKFIHSAEFR